MGRNTIDVQFMFRYVPEAIVESRSLRFDSFNYKKKEHRD